MKQRITNAKIVNEGSIVEGDLVIDGDRIEVEPGQSFTGSALFECCSSTII